jgi:hypothetical protein
VQTLTALTQVCWVRRESRKTMREKRGGENLTWRKATMLIVSAVLGE